MFKLNGKVLPLDVPFVHNGVAYPGNWLYTATQADRDALGIIWVDQQPRPDDRFFYVQDNGDGTYTATPKDVNRLKLSLIAEARAGARGTLSTTDWYAIRTMDNGKPAPVAVRQYRDAVRTACELYETEVQAATTVEELMALRIVWPEPPESIR